jgi:aldose 1-epimerase
LDFRKPTSIGLHINDDYEQLKYGKGYDHNWVLNNYSKGKLERSCYDEKGTMMEVITDQPDFSFILEIKWYYQRQR